jgi:hypothetical protein
MNSKNKGNTFERKIATTLSQRFKEHTGVEQAFRRNIDSGSFFGGKNANRTISHDLEKATFGDIVCPNDFSFTIECKHYKLPPSFSSILKQENATLNSWIEQGLSDAKHAQRHMMIIAKFNLVPEIAILEGLREDRLMSYKNYSIYSLETILSYPDNFFFV